jgi:hypothetical protein
MSRLVGTLPNPGQGSELAGLKPWLKNAKIGHFQTLEMTNFPNLKSLWEHVMMIDA